jgi:hypothetical protein
MVKHFTARAGRLAQHTGARNHSFRHRRLGIEIEKLRQHAEVNNVAIITGARGGPHPIIIKQTSVARYTALAETAGGFSVTPNEGDRHFQGIEFPGVTPIPSVIFYRTRHVGLPRFSVRLNYASLTQYTFAENDPPERCWHEIIPADALMAQNNELVFAVYPDDPNGEVTFGDVVILYTSNDTTVEVALTLNP